MSTASRPGRLTRKSESWLIIARMMNKMVCWLRRILTDAGIAIK